MLINALCEYYDELAKEGKVVPEGYSKQPIDYIITITPEGKMDSIIPEEKITPTYAPRREKTTSIKAHKLDHRAGYIFGLEYDSENKKMCIAIEKHNKFVEMNLSFIKGMSSPLINAYRIFLETWIPENETENPFLLKIAPKMNSAKFAFSLTGTPNENLFSEPEIKNKVLSDLTENGKYEKDIARSQCAITGNMSVISKLHDNIKGIAGTKSSTLISYNETAFCSYTNKASYNSNISNEAMKKYTEALNSLLSDKKHYTIIDDTTVVYWATGGSVNNDCCDLFNSFFNDTTNSEEDKMDISQTDQMLSDTFNLAREGRITRERISDLTGISENIDFYIVGFKPNSSRLALKFIYRRRFADILFSIAKHQEDMYITGIQKSVPLWQLKKALVRYLKKADNNSEKNDKSGKKKESNIGATLLSSILKSILYGTSYPDNMLFSLVTRMKIDKIDIDKDFIGRYINAVRAGAIKACINRQARAVNKKEELTVALDINNTNQAYLCGRLFAVLEKIQRISLNGNEINRTIKDAYFASAASKPSLVFPKLLSLSQNHIKKLNDGNKVFYSKMVQEIISKIDGEFPDTLMLTDQGKFMIGYYHQVQAFFEKNNKEEN